jgi:protein SCO1/2
MMRATLLGCCVVALSVAASAQQRFWGEAARPAGPPPDVLPKIQVDQKLGAQVPLDTKFVDEYGRSVRLREYFTGKPVLIVPAYFKCVTVCPLVLNGIRDCLINVPFDIGKDFTVVVISFNPKDTPEAARKKKGSLLAEYSRPGSENGWHMLTGREEDIKAVMSSMGYNYVYEPTSGQFIHSAAVIFCTPDGRIARYDFGLPNERGIAFAPMQTRLALLEAGQGKIGSIVDSVLLYCYIYDPLQRGYGLSIMRILQLGGILTVAIVALLIFSSLRRERKGMGVVGVRAGDSLDSKSRHGNDLGAQN